jgi:hypothetical protein
MILMPGTGHVQWRTLIAGAVMLAAAASNGVSYAGWVAGYSTTASITLGTYSQFGASTVYASLTATQTDGTVKTYSGTYTVSGGVIVAADIAQTS